MDNVQSVVGVACDGCPVVDTDIAVTIDICQLCQMDSAPNKWKTIQRRAKELKLKAPGTYLKDTDFNNIS